MGGYITNKPNKMIEAKVFEIQLAKNATQFIKYLLNVADYAQMKYNNKGGVVMWRLMKPQFENPFMPIAKKKRIKKGMI